MSAAEILIVDDNLPYRMLISAFVRNCGYTVLQAQDGQQALDIIAKTPPPDVTLLDLQMQPMGGFEFMEEYIRRGFTNPVILITAQMETDILTRATKLGIAGVLQKPVDEKRIAEIIRRALPVS